MALIRNEALLKKISLKIKKLREGQGITQEEFYHDTGIHLGRIEAMKHNITVSTLDAVCKYFKISLEQFFKDV